VFKNEQWSEPEAAPGEAGFCNPTPSARFCIDGTGRLHMLFSVSGEKPLDYNSWTETDGWGTTVRLPLSFPPNSIESGPGDLSTACTTDGRLLVMGQGNGHVHLTQRHPDGTWDPPTEVYSYDEDMYYVNFEISQPFDGVDSPALLFFPFSTPAVTLWKDGTTTQQAISGGFKSPGHMDGLPNGAVSVLWWDQGGLGTQSLVGLAWHEGAFAPQQVVVADATHHQSRMIAAADPSGTEIHYVWQQRDTLNDMGGTTANLCHVRPVP
jgi:hypothetical protein